MPFFLALLIAPPSHAICKGIVESLQRWHFDKTVRRHSVSDDELYDLYFRTLPPVHAAYIRIGTPISTVNENGNLENAVVVGFKEEAIEVVSPRTGERSRIGRDGAYRPVRRGTGVLYGDGGDSPKPRLVSAVGDDNRVTFLDSDTPVAMDALGLRPRGGTSTGGKDFSVAIEPEETLELIDEVADLGDIYAESGFSGRYTSSHEALFGKIQREMQRQGVWTVLDTPEGAASSLYILGAHRNGNRIARLYTKVMEQQQGRLLSLSPSELFGCDEHCIGITTPHGRITLDGYAAIDILTHKRGMSFFHEARHQMFNIRRRTGLGSIFNHLLMVGRQAGRDLDGNEISKIPKSIFEGYAFSMTLEEIYTHTYDLSYYVREMKKQDWDPGFWAKQAFIEKADIFWKISRNVQEITANILADFPSPTKNATIEARDDYGNRSIVVADSYGREVAVHIGQGEPPEADELVGFLGSHLEEINRFAASVLARKPIIDGILAEGNDSGGFSRLSREMLLLRRLMQERMHD